MYVKVRVLRHKEIKTTNKKNYNIRKNTFSENHIGYLYLGQVGLQRMYRIKIVFFF